MNLGTKIYANLQGDRAIWLVVALLSIISLLVVYSSTGMLAIKEQGGDAEFYLAKHGLILGFGLFLTYLSYRMHYMKFNRLAPYLFLISIPLLIYTIFYGADLNSAKRWIMIPFVGITFQTSDFAKLALIVYVAREITKKQEYIKDLKSAFVPIIVPVLIVCTLIAPADLSSALLLFLTCIIMMYIGRVSTKYIILLLFLGVVVFSGLIVIGRFAPDKVRVETWISRVQDFVQQEEGGYQLQQAKIALANGGIIGVGPGNSVQRNHLPQAYSDFIYSIITEEYGLIGAFVVMLLYMILLFRTIRLVTISPKAFGAMLAVGLTMSLVIQALANIAVNVHLVPVTGLTLPLLSMGGTSVLFTCISLGMILSVSRTIEVIKRQQEVVETQ